MKLVFRQHAVERMFERGLGVDDVAAALRDGRIIEDYPTDFPHGSALWLGLAGGKPLHVVAADNVAADERIIITVYEPDPALWGADWATKEETMKCPVCRHGETRPGRATVTLARGDSTVVFKDVPAEVCENCGEAFHSEQVTRALLAQAEDAARAGVEVDVRRYAAV